MSFYIFEDEPIGDASGADQNRNISCFKPEKRQFGTVLSNENQVHTSSMVSKSSPGLGTSILATHANISSLASVDSENSCDEVTDYSPLNYKPVVSPTDSKDSCMSTELLLSSDGYFEEIGQYLLDMETKFKCNPNYMCRQRDLSHPMRSVLIDWLVEVVDEYKLQRRTLFLAVAMMDKFLCEMAVLRNKLQLLGATCLFVASKFEEIYPPEASEFAYLTEDTYTVAQILKLERLLLRVLNFQVSFPTTDVFSDRILASFHFPEDQVNLIKYITELSLTFGELFLQYLPSTISAAAVCLSNICIGLDDDELWSEELKSVSGKDIPDFADCLMLLSEAMQQAASSSCCKSLAVRYKSVANCLPNLERMGTIKSLLSAFPEKSMEV